MMMYTVNSINVWPLDGYIHKIVFNTFYAGEDKVFNIVYSYFPLCIYHSVCPIKIIF